MSTFLTATIKVAGFHCWPGAPATVGYLRSPHRHLFTFKATLSALHGDRFVEFHLLGAECKRLLAGHYPAADWVEGTDLDFGSNSCEHLASALADLLMGEGHAPQHVEVWEDDENGGGWSL